MNKTIKILIGVLVVQLVLVVIFYSRGDKLATFVPNEQILAMSAGEIVKITVEEGEKDTGGKSEKVTLERVEGTWQLPERNSFPALETKVKGLIEKLGQMKKSWPVATTEIASRQLKTAQDSFERKLTIKQGSNDLVIYLGTSPTFKKVHLRVDGDLNTYAVDFASHEASANSNDWLDKLFFAAPKDKIRKVSANDFVLKVENGNPLVEGLAEAQETNVDKSNDFLKKLSTLSFDELLTEEEKVKFAEEKPVWEFTIEKANNTVDTYQFREVVTESKPADDKNPQAEKKVDKYVLKVSSQPFFVKIAKTVFDDLKKVLKAELVKNKSEAKAAPAGNPDATSSEPSKNVASPNPAEGEEPMSSPDIIQMEEGEDVGPENMSLDDLEQNEDEVEVEELEVEDDVQPEIIPVPETGNGTPAPHGENHTRQ